MPDGHPESNLFALDYRAEAARLGPPVVPIIDAHAHINGRDAAAVYREVREVFGVTLTYSMTQIGEAEAVRSVLGDSVRFIAMPRFSGPDAAARLHGHTTGFLEDLVRWHELGARVCKMWCAPRILEIGRELGDVTIGRLDGPWRRRHMDRAAELGMMFMAHIADPDTWFATRYKDASFYGSKASHYEPLERMLEAYPVPWIVAHMGGWPEDLAFLAGLLDRHANLHLDTSATKWMVRELSKHPPGAVESFVRRYKDRVLFGSDIVTLDDQLRAEKVSTIAGGEKARQASTREQAFDLYAGRYLALRTLWETAHDGPCFFADADLNMVDPERSAKTQPARLVGQRLPFDLLRALYSENARRLLGGWWARG